MFQSYHLFISPALQLWLGTSLGCRFQPSCSCYAQQVLLEKGFHKGLMLILKRLCRCHPWGTPDVPKVPNTMNPLYSFDQKAGNPYGT